MLIQTYNWKGVDWQSAIKVTGYKVTDGSNAGLVNVELEINRYTDSTCEHDIEQIPKSFTDVDVSIFTCTECHDFEALLQTDPDFTNAT